MYKVIGLDPLYNEIPNRSLNKNFRSYDRAVEYGKSILPTLFTDDVSGERIVVKKTRRDTRVLLKGSDVNYDLHVKVYETR